MDLQNFYYVAGGLSALLASFTYCIREYQDVMSKEMDYSRNLQSRILPEINRLDYDINNYRDNLESEYVEYIVTQLMKLKHQSQKEIVSSINKYSISIIKGSAKAYAYQNVLRKLNLWASLINKHPLLRYLIKYDDRKYFIKVIENHRRIIDNITREQKLSGSSNNYRDIKFFHLWKLYNYWV